MPTTLQLRRGTTAENAAFTGAEGELTVDTQTNSLNVHDGSTVGGNAITGGGGGGGAAFTGVESAFSTSHLLFGHNVTKATSSKTESTSNRITYHPMWFLFPVTITKLGFFVGTADAAATDTRVAIYDQHPTTAMPNTLLAETGHIATPTSNSVLTETLGTPLVLPAGIYWFAVKTDSVTLAMSSVDSDSTWGSPLGINRGAAKFRQPYINGALGAFAATAPTLTDSYSASDHRVAGYQ